MPHLASMNLLHNELLEISMDRPLDFDESEIVSANTSFNTSGILPSIDGVSFGSDNKRCSPQIIRLLLPIKYE